MWLPQNEPKARKRRKREFRDLRNGVALTIYRLTEDNRWHDIFLEDTVLTDLDLPEIPKQSKTEA